MEELLRLFRSDRDAVLLADGDRVAGANPAAAGLFGRDVTGEAVSALLPERPGPHETAAVSVNGKSCQWTEEPYGSWQVLRLAPDEAVPVSPAALSRLRVAAAGLGLGLERLTGPEARDSGTASVYRSYFALVHGIEQLSDRASLLRGDMALTMAAVDLGELAGTLADSVNAFSAGKTAVIDFVPWPGDLTVRGDRERLEQLVLILLANSLSHTPPEGTVRLLPRKSGSRVTLTVEDRGSGLTADALAEAFRPRRGESLSAMAEGAGLGLSIARGIAALHGGTLLLESREGECVRVTLSLPAPGAALLRDASPAPVPNARGILSELSGVLPVEAFLPGKRE